MAKSISVPAPAKINLYLHVTGRRDDGYHTLSSLIAFAGYGDTVEAEAADGLSLHVDGPFGAGLDAGPDNLVVRAARYLAEKAGIEANAKLRLVKRLPVASGIGGGSADAAATLQALCRLWDLTPPEDAGLEMVHALGADVPACVAGHTAFVGGIGELIGEPVALPPAWLVLANPGSAVPTPSVFAARHGDFTAASQFSEIPADAARLAQLLADRGNDLTDAAITIAPEIAGVLDAMSALPGQLLHRLCGSGGTCFAMFADGQSAANAADRLAAAHPRWWVVSAPLLNRTSGAEDFV